MFQRSVNVTNKCDKSVHELTLFVTAWLPENRMWSLACTLTHPART